MERSDETVSAPWVEEVMTMTYESVADMGMEQALATAKTEDFLMLATSKYGSVPVDRQAQVRAASVPQIEYWLPRILTAPSIQAVFDDDTGSGHAANRVPAPPPPRKRVAN